MPQHNVPLPPQASRPLMRRVRVAARMVVALGIGLTVGHYIGEGIVAHRQPEHSVSVPAPPEFSESAAQRAASSSVVKIVNESDACEYTATGTGWAVAPDYFVTNAHVVAGESSLSVTAPDGGQVSGTVVHFDPPHDLAVVYAPGLGVAPLPLSAGDPARGTLFYDFGYAKGGPLAATTGEVLSEQTIDVPTIYDVGHDTRAVEGVAGYVVPGDSGGPFVDAQGQVVGVAFARVDGAGHLALGIPPSTVRSVAVPSIGKTAPVATTWEGRTCVD